jgi:hypothetical protein
MVIHFYIFIVLGQLICTDCLPTILPPAQPNEISPQIQEWLIQSINLMRRELNELGHNYNVHINTKEAEEIQSRQSLVHDLAVLRADHTILSNQQKQLIELIQQKVSRNNKEDSLKSDNIPESGDDQREMRSRGHHDRRHHHRRHHHKKHLESQEPPKKAEEIAKLEEYTKERISSLSQELTSLHDVTISLFRDVQDLEQRMTEDQQKKKRQETIQQQNRDEDNTEDRIEGDSSSRSSRR